MTAAVAIMPSESAAVAILDRLEANRGNVGRAFRALSVTPALGAPRQIEGFCFERAQHVPCRGEAPGKRSWLTA
jgi:hypothetical protein